MCVHLLQFRQLVTLPNLRIINYVIGHCGSAHDSTVFHDSRTYRNSSILFNENEWMWADSVYALDSWCITPYKRPHTALPENKTFNYHLSQVHSSFHSFWNSSCYDFSYFVLFTYVFSLFLEVSHGAAALTHFSLTHISATLLTHCTAIVLTHSIAILIALPHWCSIYSGQSCRLFFS